MIFESKFHKIGNIQLPEFTGIRVMMMPLIIGETSSIPPNLNHYSKTIGRLFDLSNPTHHGKVGYITIDEKQVKAGTTHRRSGLHVDGVYQGKCGGWGGGGGGWGSVGNGMLTVSSVAGCRAYNQVFNGQPGFEGECDKLADQCKDGTVFEADTVYWADGLCVHESIPMSQDTERQFIRLSMPSMAPWFEGYTENPLGIKPAGKILPRRSFLDM